MKYNDFEYTVINFGKYKGHFMRDVPDNYLLWAIQNIQDEALASMFSIEYQRRHKNYRNIKHEGHKL